MAKFSANQIINKATKLAEQAWGAKARATASISKSVAHAATPKEFGGMAVKGISDDAVRRTQRIAKVENGRTLQARVKVGLGATATTTAGFLGLHKYHQHKDNKILARIDKMYEY